MTARFKSCHSKTTIIQVYAPTEEAEEEEKDDFYNSLQDTLNEILKHNIKILMGDMNAQISRNRDGFEQMMIGPFGSASHTNNNGERLILFCGINDHCIENSYFRHKMIHKYTWRSPDGNTKNEIDYLCISQR